VTTSGVRRSSKTKPPLVVFAPYPPAKSGIADYVAELMPLHRAEFDVTLVIADDASLPDETAPRTLLASEFRQHHHFFADTPKLYHFGNNAQHCYMLDFVATDPGVVVLHDFNLGYLHEMATLRWGERGRFIRAAEREYGALGGSIVRHQFDLGFREAFAGYELPLNGFVLENATAVVTHSRQVQYKIAARAPRTPVWYIPHHLSPSVAAHAGLTRTAARKRIGISPDRLLVTAMGFITRAKQIPLTLAALASLRGEVPPFRFLLAGERRPHEYDVDADIARSGLKDLTTCTDYLEDERFFEMLAATDIVVNLRYPSGGEMSGTLVRALGMGVATIVLDYGPIGELPHQVARKITWDGNAQASLTEALRELLTDAAARKALGNGAANYVRTVHSIEQVAERYSRIIRKADAGARPARQLPTAQYEAAQGFMARRLRELGDRAVSAASAADGCLWWRAAAVPLGVPGRPALVISSRPKETAALLSLLFEWESGSISAFTPDEFLSQTVRDAQDRPIAADTFALAVAVLPESGLAEADAALLMRRLNTSLRADAKILLEVWSDADEKPRKNAPLAEAGILQRLAEAGFGELRAVSPQDGLMAELIFPALNEDYAMRFACFAGRKTSDYAVWRFVDQYEGFPTLWGGRTRMRCNE
jgi:glycosyltransferase involved in cell wall biosynthesis